MLLDYLWIAGVHDCCRCVARVKSAVMGPVFPLLGLLLILSGCTVGPDFKRPTAKVQPQWSDTADPKLAANLAVNTRWWKSFNDPTLDKLVEIARQENLSLETAGIRILESRARLAIAVGLQYPQTQEVRGSITKVGLSNHAPNVARSDRFFWDYQAGFDAAWELDFWGRFRRGVESEQAGEKAAAADYDNALVSVTAEVARTYISIRIEETLLQLARDNIRIQEEGLRMAETRFRAGSTTELDVTQARTLLESTRATVPDLESRLRQEENALSVLLGRPPGNIRALLNGPKRIPAPPERVAVGVPAELLCRRPDVRSIELQAAAQSARVGISQADLYPRLSLLGNIGFETSSGGGRQSNNASCANILDGNSLFYSWGPTLQWPVLNYGRLQNAVRVEDARLQQLLVQYQDTVLNAAREVEDASIGYIKSREATAMLQASVEAAKRSVQLATVQYREGAVDYQRVLDAQRSLLEQENRLAQTQGSIVTNLVALYKALGGGWEMCQGEPFVSLCTVQQMKQRTNWGNMLPPPPRTEDLNPPAPAKDIPLLQKPAW